MKMLSCKLGHCCGIMLIAVLTAPSIAGADDAKSVSGDLFGEPVDIVTPGYLHWNSKSGDTVDPHADSHDIDNNFGEHSGKVSVPSLSDQVADYGKGSVEEEFVYVYGDNTVSWEFNVPGGGSYVFSSLLWKELTDETTVVFSFKRDGQWIDLPAIDDAREWPHFGRPFWFQIDVPEGVTRLPMRARTEKGRGLINRMLLGKLRDKSPFITPEEPTEHPHLYFRSKDIPALRKKIKSGPPKLAYDYMLANTEVYRKGMVKWQRKGGHVVGRSVIQTAFVYVMTNDRKHLESVLKMIDKIMSWKHDPDVIKTTMVPEERYNVLERGRQLSAIVLVYDWLYHDIPVKKREEIRKFIADEANRLYVYNECQEGNLEIGNWGPWVGAGYGMAGILFRNEHKWADKWIESEKRIVDVNLRTSGEDFGYFMNGFVKAMDFGITLQTATGEDIFTPNAKRLQALLEYRMTLLTPQQDGYPSFGDARARNEPLLAMCLTAYLDDRLAQWYLHNLSCANPKQVRNWAWNHMFPVAVVTMYRDDLKPQAPNAERLSLAKSFWEDKNLPPGLRPVTVLRTGYGRSTDVQFSIRCGQYGGWHGHPNQGNFMLNAFGDHMTADIARGGTYGSPKSNFSKTPEAHSGVLIDGQGQEKYSDEVYGRDLEAGHPGPLLHTDFVDYVESELAVAYRKNPALKNLDHAYRHFVMVRKPARHAYVVIIDDVQLDDKAHEYEWLIQSDMRHTVTVKGKNRHIIAGKAQLNLFTVEPPDIVSETLETLDTWRTLKIKPASPVKIGRFVTVLYPKTARMRLPKVERISGPTAVGARVGTPRSNETFLFALGDKPIDEAGISCDGKLVVVGYEKAKPAWILCVGATKLTIDGQIWMQSDKPVNAAFMPGVSPVVTSQTEASVTFCPGNTEAKTIQITKPGS